MQSCATTDLLSPEHQCKELITEVKGSIYIDNTDIGQKQTQKATSAVAKRYYLPSYVSASAKKNCMLPAVTSAMSTAACVLHRKLYCMATNYACNHVV